MTGLDLEAIAAEFLNQCGSCDAGMPVSCKCATRDYRPTMLALVREVEALDAEVEHLRVQLATVKALHMASEPGS